MTPKIANTAPAVASQSVPDPPLERVGTLGRWRQVALQFVPSPFKQIVEKGLLKAFLTLIAVVAVVPLLIAFLAAFWLIVLATPDFALLNALRHAYLAIIQQGFAIEEVASRSHERLDYVQLFQYDLRPHTLPMKELPVSIHPGQKVILEFTTVAFKADDKECDVPPGVIDLVSVTLGERPIQTLKEESNITIILGKAWWNDKLKTFEEGELARKLSFRLVDKLMALKCGQVHIEGSIRVFKNVFSASS